MAYRLVRCLVYTRGVGIRETVWVGVWFGKSISSVLVDRAGGVPARCKPEDPGPPDHLIISVLVR